MSKLHLGDSSTINIIKTGTYGILKNVMVAPSLNLSLISTKTLTIDNDFLILFDKRRAFILERDSLKNKSFKDAIIASATLKNDNLYHIDDMTSF